MKYLGTLVEMGKTIFGALRRLKETEGILDKKIEELCCRESDVLTKLERAKLQFGKRPKKEVELWLKNVRNMKDEVLGIKQKLGEADQNPNLLVRSTHFRSHINLANLVEEKIKEIVELNENGQFQEGLLVDLLPSSLGTFPTTELEGETTALRNLKNIEECLLDDKVGKIGVYGMAGVGKTTIMTDIRNKMQNAGTFKSVIWVTVYKDSYLERLQEDVARELGVNLINNEDPLERVAMLSEAFSHCGKFLLILDGVRSIISLTKVGIPEPNEENKCKIVWTTRSKKVRRGMESQRTIEMACLTKEESWTLFKGKLGTNFVLSLEIEPIAKAVVEECGGLPLAISTVGAAMKGVDDVRIWRSALNDLKNSRPELEGLKDDVFSCLRFSFNKLKKRHQDCFLYCALYPEDDVIDCDELIESWMANEFFDEIKDREKGFEKGYEIIHDLKDACMLEFLNGDDLSNRSFVKMHDLLRDLAIAITRKSRQFFVKTGFGIQQFPRDENLMEYVVRMSLIFKGTETLSCQLLCPKLCTLFLKDCFELKNLHHLFFNHMLNLRVLNLSFCLITCLPESLSELVHLRALLLRNCERLKRIPSLLRLKELRVLDLYCTAIRYLPKGMDGLINLRRLDLSFTGELKMFPAGIISNFSCLEELLMLASKWKWSSNRNGRGAGVEEIASLTHLRRLSFDFMDLSALSSCVRSRNWQDLKYFLLRVVSNETETVRDAREDFYCQVRDVQIYTASECMRALVVPENLRALQFIHCVNTPPLSEIPCIWSLKQLDSCLLRGCDDKMEYIVTKEENPFLPSLSELVIEQMANLKTICKEPTQGGTTLANLKQLKISNCPKLEYVFSVGWLQSLQYLEVINVEECDALEEMVVELEGMVEANDNKNNITITLPRLKNLTLFNLRQLQRISRRILVCNSLETIKIYSCPKLNMLPLSMNNMPPSLKQIEGRITWWDSLEWINPDTKLHLQCFFKDIEEEEEEKDDDGYANAEMGEDHEEEDDDGDGNDKKDATDDDEKGRRGTKRKADALMKGGGDKRCCL